MSPVGAPTGLPVRAYLRRKKTSSFLNFLSLLSYKYREHILFILSLLISCDLFS